MRDRNGPPLNVIQCVQCAAFPAPALPASRPIRERRSPPLQLSEYEPMGFVPKVHAAWLLLALGAIRRGELPNALARDWHAKYPCLLAFLYTASQFLPLRESCPSPILACSLTVDSSLRCAADSCHWRIRQTTSTQTRKSRKPEDKNPSSSFVPPAIGLT